MRPFFAKLTVLFLFVLLTGCGFHLRRPQPLPPQLTQVVLMPDGIYTPVQRELTNQLATVGCSVVDFGTKDAAILTILNDSYSDITLSVGSDGQTREKLLVYMLSFQLSDSKGNIILQPNTIRQNHVVKYDPNFVLAKGYEEDKMVHDMRVDAVTQVVTQLSFISPEQFNIPKALEQKPQIPENNHEITHDDSIESPNRDIMPLIDTDIVGD